LKLRPPIPKALVLAAIFLSAGVFASPSVCYGQVVQSWWGSSSWFDWSDYRARFDMRMWLPRLTSGTFEAGGRTLDLRTDLGFTEDPEPFRELYVELYVDRLGIRIILNESQRFQGNITRIIPDLERLFGPEFAKKALATVPELQVGGTTIGLDLDLIRLPMIRFGFDVDYQKEGFTLQETGGRSQARSRQAVTTGFYGTLLPGRIRDVPIIFQGRIRFPVPYVSSNLLQTRVTDWEVSAGLRPAIWETSLYGLSTFSVAINVGFRSMNIEFTDQTGSAGPLEQRRIDPIERGTVKATFQGAFIQVGFVF
jgi:hypothetical protein